MEDLFHGGVEDEDAAAEDDEAVAIEISLRDAWDVEFEEWLLENANEFYQDEEEDDAENDGEADSEGADKAAFFFGGALRFERNIKEIIESEHRLKHHEHEQSAEIREERRGGGGHVCGGGGDGGC